MSRTIDRGAEGFGKKDGHLVIVLRAVVILLARRFCVSRDLHLSSSASPTLKRFKRGPRIRKFCNARGNSTNAAFYGSLLGNLGMRRENKIGRPHKRVPRLVESLENLLDRVSALP